MFVTGVGLAAAAAVLGCLLVRHFRLVMAWISGSPSSFPPPLNPPSVSAEKEELPLPPPAPSRLPPLSVSSALPQQLLPPAPEPVDVLMPFSASDLRHDLRVANWESDDEGGGSRRAGSTVGWDLQDVPTEPQMRRSPSPSMGPVRPILRAPSCSGDAEPDWSSVQPPRPIRRRGLSSPPPAPSTLSKGSVSRSRPPALAGSTLQEPLRASGPAAGGRQATSRLQEAQLSLGAGADSGTLRGDARRGGGRDGGSGMWAVV